ncbi:Ig-like domain-containing protein [Enterococcus termitis]|uniref:Ig-like domain-containing protein n=1 Tax=Enterococcus termitis TaxID=332950 RepID=UPI00091361DB|nr:hypothetical protein RV18_GL001968 [Enterococcus termitis]
MSLNKTSLTLETGADEILTAVVEPQNAEDKTISFSSSDESIATVTPKQGKVTGIKTGNAKIIVTTSNGLTADCDVTITEKSGGA